MSRIVVITGGSGGIGLSLTEKFTAQGDKVYVLSRRSPTVDAAAHIKTDVSDERQVASAFAAIEKAEGRIDILINNAGCGISGAAEFASNEEVKNLFDVNFFGSLNCIRAAVSIMRKNGGGRIVNISSAAAVFSLPFQAYYSASKAAVNALTLALVSELRPFGISVCAVMPGDVKTGFTAARGKSFTGENVYGGRIAAAVKAMEHDEINGMPPDRVAEGIRSIACKRRVKPLYTVGAAYKILLFLQKLLPSGLAVRVIGKLYS